MRPIPRPAALGPETLSDAVIAVRERVGPAWERAAAWESEARVLWMRVAGQAWKGLALRQRAGRIARTAPRLVEGTGSALFRAARAQPLPWELDQGPLGTFARDLAAFSAAAREVLDVAEGQDRAAARLAALQARWALDFPGGWRRWTRVLALDPGEVYDGDTADDVRALSGRIDRLEQEMARWEAEVESGLAREDADGSGAWLGVSEGRYLALRSIGAADRKTALGRAAEATRRASGAHLAALPAPDRSEWEILVRDLAGQWMALSPGEPLSAEETACYRAALAEAYARADGAKAATRGGAGGRDDTAPAPAAGAERPSATLYATLLDERAGPGAVVVRRSPATALRVRVEEGGVGRMEVAMPDSMPALEPAGLADVLRFFHEAGDVAHPYWWATSEAAVLELRQVRGGRGEEGDPHPEAVFVGSLRRHGGVSRLAEPPDAHPRPQGDWPLFRAWRRPAPGDPAVYLDRDPRLKPPAAVYRSRDVDCWVAEVLELGPGPVWLRTAADTASAPVPDAVFDAEAGFLARLSAQLPGSVAAVAHRGSVDLARRGARAAYLATAAPLGNPAERWLRAAGPAQAADWGTDLAAGLLHVLEAAHAEQLCAGAVIGACVRVRPAFHLTPPV
ncbi:MAG TPA: hypothetical protein VFJ82_20920, partial [Longimicrobium sp.]|nr:hypothetical protein [Longimicrobium sp.]